MRDVNRLEIAAEIHVQLHLLHDSALLIHVFAGLSTKLLGSVDGALKPQLMASNLNSGNYYCAKLIFTHFQLAPKKPKIFLHQPIDLSLWGYRCRAQHDHHHNSI